MLFMHPVRKYPHATYCANRAEPPIDLRDIYYKMTVEVLAYDVLAYMTSLFPTNVAFEGIEPMHVFN